ncbi:MAG: carbon-nitrogen hydrolase family protein [Granulosicoccus sp.]
MGETLDIVVLQPPGNLDGAARRLEWLDMHIQQSPVTTADLLVLPELFHCGYHTSRAIADVAESSDGPFASHIKQLAKEHSIAVVYGYAEKTAEGIYNSAQCIDKKGHTIGHHRKLLLPPGIEQSVFTQGNGCSVFQLGKFTVSILICYDAEFPESVRHVANAGAELVIVPTALAQEWAVISEKIIPARAFENGVYIAYANHCGLENNLMYFGGSCIIAPTGNELARACEATATLTATIDKNTLRQAQKRLPYLKDCQRLPLS